MDINQLIERLREKKSQLAQLAEHGMNRNGTHEGCVDFSAVDSLAEEIGALLDEYENPTPTQVHSTNSDLPKRWQHLPREIAMQRMRQSRKNKRRNLTATSQG